MIKKILAFVVMGVLATGVAARAADAPKNDYVGVTSKSCMRPRTRTPSKA
jgi:hypothetical protein